MTWTNEAEIDNLKERYAGDVVLGPATQFLADYRDLINGCSDGWAYWHYGTRCAGSLVELVTQADYAQRGVRHLLPPGYTPPTFKDVVRAADKVRRFVKREPQLAGQVAPTLRGE